jgi:DUF4097 and DUF4098 domain-containing protein YvlB
MTMPTYPTPEPVRVVVRIPAGRVDITTEDSTETTVNVRRLGRGNGSVGPDEVKIDYRPSRREDGQLLIVAEHGHRSWFGKENSYEVEIRTPHGADVQAVTASADIRGSGRFGDVDVRTASGDAFFDDMTGRGTVKSASGDIRLGDVGGQVSVNTTSGDAEIRRAGGDVTAALVSGDLIVRTAAGDIKARSVSGDLRIESFDRGSAQMTTVSGDVQIAVLPDRRVWMDLSSRSGDTSCDLAVGDGEGSGEASVSIEARSVSGDVRIRRASA